MRFEQRPEILAPAGNAEMMHAAVENGADAVYFGLQEFNARLRADNFSVRDLPQTMQTLHARGVKGYVTLNILIFQNELEEAADLLRACSQAGVDAVLIQDLGLAYLAKRIAPQLPVHASTQMTLTCAESIAGAERLGLVLERVVTARELSRRELGVLCKQTEKEIEVFVHGALCVAYSGQCLTSEALGGRSANRGECAQACRLPYDLIVDGEHKPLEDLRYLLSPKDLAAHDDVAELLELGIVSLKIEGRLKTPEYVAATVQAYRAAVDAAIAGEQGWKLDTARRQRLEATFSRGFTGGYIHEINHQTVVEGAFPNKRGTYLGEVLEIRREAVVVALNSALKPGDGVLFDTGNPDREQGGAVYEMFINNKPCKEYIPRKDVPVAVELRFADRRIDFGKLIIGRGVWKTSDPRIESELRASFAGETIRYRRPVAALLRAQTGHYLELTLSDWEGNSVFVVGDIQLERAEKHPATIEFVREQLSRLGDTPFFLNECAADIVGAPLVPASRLNALRREAVAALIELRLTKNARHAAPALTFSEVRQELMHPVPSKPLAPELSVLCRSIEQVEAALSLPVTRVYTDFEDIRHHREAKALAEAAGRSIIPATLRIVKPQEAATVRKLLQLEPEAVLVRNLASWQILATEAPQVKIFGDYSLNVANDLTARLLYSNGFTYLTPSYDLNSEQLAELLRESQGIPFEVTIHQYMPMFHMEHCVFCRFLSSGTDSSNCGRPCEDFTVELRDRKGVQHPLKADFACRNTVFNGVAQSAVEYLEQLQAAGASAFRIDLLSETAAEVQNAVTVYSEVLAGTRSATGLWETLRAASKLGVTRGSLDRERLTADGRLYGIGKRKPAHASVVD